MKTVIESGEIFASVGQQRSNLGLIECTFRDPGRIYRHVNHVIFIQKIFETFVNAVEFDLEYSPIRIPT